MTAKEILAAFDLGDPNGDQGWWADDYQRTLAEHLAKALVERDNAVEMLDQAKNAFAARTAELEAANAGLHMELLSLTLAAEPDIERNRIDAQIEALEWAARALHISG